jgi:heat shock protein HslJ
MKKLLIVLIFALALVACGSAEPTPTPAPPPTEPPPTAVPTEVPPTALPPTEVPVEAPSGSAVDEMEHTPDPALIDQTWAWERRDPNGNDIAAITITNPENYTLLFNEDGSFNARVDCNVMGGSYTTNAAGSIAMQGGPMTMAFCGEESYDQAMMQMVASIQNYRFAEDGEVLVFPWPAGGPVDYYRLVPTLELTSPAEGAATGTVTAPDGIFLRTGPGTGYPYIGAAPQGASGEVIGVSQDGEWWLVNTPNLPGGQIWASAQFVEVSNAEAVPVVAAPTVEPLLVGTPWQWVSTTNPVDGAVPVGDPTRYLIRFNEDGSANIQADCNSVIASYTTDGSSISIMPGPSTLVACPPDSQADQFVSQLSSAAIYFIQNGNLFMDLPFDSGTMRFAPQGTPPPATETPAGEEAEGLTFYLTAFGPVAAPQPIIAGTLISANFSGNRVTGSAGCNNYSGTLTPVEDYFQVTGIITTMMMCAEDVMAQEQAYLAGLGTITGYLWAQTRTEAGFLLTQGQIFYALPDGAPGVMIFAGTP